MNNENNMASRRRFLSLFGLGALVAMFYSIIIPKKAQAMTSRRERQQRRVQSRMVQAHPMAVKRDK